MLSFDWIGVFCIDFCLGFCLSFCFFVVDFTLYFCLVGQLGILVWFIFWLLSCPVFGDEVPEVGSINLMFFTERAKSIFVL